MLKNNSLYTYIELLTMRSAKDFCFKLSGYDKLIYVLVKPIGQKYGINAHEFLTAALILLDKDFIIPTNQNEIFCIYKQIEDLVIKQNKIKNYSINEINSIEYDYNSLCQAISSYNTFKLYIKEIPELVYLTGNKKWDDDISHLKYIDKDLKNYNSSDIIFKIGKTFNGISLKRKENNQVKDPPIINKSLLGLFKNNEVIKDKLENILSVYFINLYNSLNTLIHSNMNNWKKCISEVDIDVINEHIKNDKCILWENIRTVLFQNKEYICENLFNQILRINLKEIKQKHNFNFNIITGIGNFKSDKLIIEEGELITLDSILKVYEKYIKNKTLDIRRNKEKESIYQSTLFLTLYADEIPLINLEIRYKGRFHCSPEVLAFLTSDMKKLINNINEH